MTKKVPLAVKAKPATAPNIDSWINGATVTDNEPVARESRVEEAIVMKRLTLDIPEELHTRIKSQCALRRTKMVDEIRELLETHFPG